METINLFKALADSTRVRILHLIADRELCVCNLSGILNMPQSSLSHHLALLKDAGYIQSRKNGKWSYYKLDTKILDEERNTLLTMLLENTANESLVVIDKEKRQKLPAGCSL